MKLKILTALLLSLFFSIVLNAQPGALDDGFATDGILVTSLDFGPVGNNVAYSSLIQPDGKIVFAGNSFAGVIVVRLNEDGSLDETFGTGGKTTLELPFDFNSIQAIARQQDGKIVALGSSSSYGGTDPTLWMLRYNADGSFDTGFGQNGTGYLEVELGFTSHSVGVILVQPDGKIVIAGGGYISGWNGFLARFLETGEPDLSFGEDGYQHVTFNVGSQLVYGVVLLGGGQFIVGGTKLTRINPDGSTDAAFGESGVADPGVIVVGLAVQSDGKILVAGSPDDEVVVKRYEVNGVLDTSYGDGGSVVVGAGPGTFTRYITSAVLQSDGKLVAVGGVSSQGQSKVTLLRFTSDGVLDSEFGQGGIVSTDVKPDEVDRAEHATMQLDGKIIVVGFSRKQWGNDFMVLRYLSGLETGTIDFSIGNNQVLIYPNPIGETATLKYTLADRENISIRLYGIDGKLLHTFMENEEKSIGEHAETLVWPKGIPSGNYILGISSASGQVGVKIVK